MNLSGGLAGGDNLARFAKPRPAATQAIHRCLASLRAPVVGGPTRSVGYVIIRADTEGSTVLLGVGFLPVAQPLVAFLVDFLHKAALRRVAEEGRQFVGGGLKDVVRGVRVVGHHYLVLFVCLGLTLLLGFGVLVLFFGHLAVPFIRRLEVIGAASGSGDFISRPAQLREHLGGVNDLHEGVIQVVNLETQTRLVTQLGHVRIPE